MKTCEFCDGEGSTLVCVCNGGCCYERERCDECDGRGYVHVGDSGTEADGYAPVFERCTECGYGTENANVD